jgi:hypothetical protein
MWVPNVMLLEVSPGCELVLDEPQAAIPNAPAAASATGHVIRDILMSLSSL